MGAEDPGEPRVRRWQRVRQWRRGHQLRHWRHDTWRGRLVVSFLAAQLVLAGSLVAASRSSARAHHRGTVAVGPAATPPSPVPTTTTVPAPPVTSPVGPVPSTPASASASAPAPAAGPAPASGLAARLDGAFGAVPGCVVVDDGAAEVASRDADLPLVPASTQKLLVAAAALAELGVDHRIETTVEAAAPPRNGTVDALWLVGGGDPLLASPEYAAWLSSRPRTRDAPTTPLVSLADQLAAQGLHSVPGGIHGDDNRYDRLRYLPTWNAKYAAEGDIGPLGALTVNGGFTSWRGSIAAAVDPAAYATSELVRLLGQRGVAAGAADDGVTPPRSVVLARVQSQPLAQLVEFMLRTSDNLTAELLVRELDRHAGGLGTTAGGTAQALAVLARLGLPVGGIHPVDGSGLDAGNRSTCRLELALLKLGDRPGFESLARGLAVAGQSGTLVHRWVGTPIAGRLAAKTGWIEGAAGMVGRLEGRRSLRFAFLANGVVRWPAAQALEDRVIAALAAYADV